MLPDNNLQFVHSVKIHWCTLAWS